MALLGNAAVVIWSEMADPLAHDLWHSREHLPERTSIPGFLRARRCVASEAGGPRYFVLYELRDAAVLTSAGYLDRLNNPTGWTRRMMAEALSLNRTLCRVAASHGAGIGGYVRTIQVQPQDGTRAALHGWLVGEALPAIVAEGVVVAAHLLQREEAIERPDTVERQLRRRPDGFVDWVVMLEGYDEAALSEASSHRLSAAALASHGAGGANEAAYRVAHVMVAGDAGS